VHPTRLLRVECNALGVATREVGVAGDEAAHRDSIPLIGTEQAPRARLLVELSGTDRRGHVLDSSRWIESSANSITG
jgi:hypothetical protein